MITLIIGVSNDGKEVPITYIRGSRCHQKKRADKVLKKLNTNPDKKYKHYKPMIIKSHLEKGEGGFGKN